MVCRKPPQLSTFAEIQRWMRVHGEQYRIAVYEDTISIPVTQVQDRFRFFLASTSSKRCFQPELIHLQER